jgi:hypothetical protein
MRRAEETGLGTTDGPREPSSETRLRLPDVPRDAYAAIGAPAFARTVLALRRHRESVTEDPMGLVEAERAALRAQVEDVRRFTERLCRELGLPLELVPFDPEPAPDFDGADTMPSPPPEEP